MLSRVGGLPAVRALGHTAVSTAVARLLEENRIATRPDQLGRATTRSTCRLRVPGQIKDGYRRIVIADDQAVGRRGLRQLLRRRAGP